jgi:hypothetical protein
VPAAAAGLTDEPDVTAIATTTDPTPRLQEKVTREGRRSMRFIRLSLAVATAGLMLGASSPRVLADDDQDDKQEQEIRTSLQKAPDLKDDYIAVDVDDGIAQLKGTVDSQAEKRKATQVAHVQGILGVDNRLEVRPAGK